MSERPSLLQGRQTKAISRGLYCFVKARTDWYEAVTLYAAITSKCEIINSIIFIKFAELFLDN